MVGLIFLLAAHIQTHATPPKPGLVTAIVFERTPCYGTCPVYSVRLEPGGTLRYHGERFVKRVGDFTASFPSYEFERIGEAVDRIGFDQLRKAYSSDGTDQPTAITTVKRGSKTKSVSDYGYVGPAELWLLDEAIDGIVAEATDWKPMKTRKEK